MGKCAFSHFSFRAGYEIGVATTRETRFSSVVLVDGTFLFLNYISKGENL